MGVVTQDMVQAQLGRATIADDSEELNTWRTLGEVSQLGDFDVDRARQAYDTAAGAWYEAMAP